MRDSPIGIIADYRIEGAEIPEDVFFDVLINQMYGLIFTADIIVFEKGLLELWSPFVDDIPYDIVIDICVHMHDDVSHALNLPPFDTRKIPTARLEADFGDEFAYLRDRYEKGVSNERAVLPEILIDVEVVEFLCNIIASKQHLMEYLDFWLCHI